MENATKALLIAATVLIAIVLIATGVVLLRNTSSTTQQATEIGEVIKDKTDEVSSSIMGGIKNTILSKKKFIEWLDKYVPSKRQGFYTLVSASEDDLSNQIELIGYVNVRNVYEIINAANEERKNDYKDIDDFSDVNKREKAISNLENRGTIKKISNPYGNPMDAFKKNVTLPNDKKINYQACEFSIEKDNDDKINKVVYIYEVGWQDK